MRILLDTNILARATPGPSSLARELLRLASLPPDVEIVQELRATANQQN